MKSDFGELNEEMNTLVQPRFVENLLGVGHLASSWSNSDIVPGFAELTWWEGEDGEHRNV